MMSQTQLGLFDEPDTFGPDPKALSRRTDPDTSHAAAELVNLSELEKQFMQAFDQFNYPPTAQEVADRAVPIDGTMSIGAAVAKRESIRKRAGELAKPKYSKDGVLIRPEILKVSDKRECYMSGREASTYERITNGQEARKAK